MSANDPKWTSTWYVIILHQAAPGLLLPHASGSASPRIGEAGLDAGTVLHIAWVPARKAVSRAGGSTVFSACGARRLTCAYGDLAILHARALSLRQIRLGLRQIKDRSRRGYQQHDEQQFLHLGPPVTRGYSMGLTTDLERLKPRRVSASFSTKEKWKRDAAPNKKAHFAARCRQLALSGR
jgi:hypothetical protein